MKRMVVKIGSRVLTRMDGSLKAEKIDDFVADIARLRKEKGCEVIIVTSGAVSAGSGIVNIDSIALGTEAINYSEKILKEQILASFGQVELISSYREKFLTHGIRISQFMVTREDFAKRPEYLSLRTVTEHVLKLGGVPTFNENDVLSPAELDFVDNDQLACIIAAMAGADLLLVLTDVDGVYNGTPGAEGVEVIGEIDDVSAYLEKVDDSKGTGKGGMRSKMLSAELATSLGISMRIANGLAKNVIWRVAVGENIGTSFLPSSRKVSTVKAWLATSATSEGKIYVSTYLADILRKKQTASILFAGIENIEGDFASKDVVEILDENGMALGKGFVKFSSEDLRSKVFVFKAMDENQKSKMKTSEIIAVHYDYFVFA